MAKGRHGGGGGDVFLLIGMFCLSFLPLAWMIANLVVYSGSSSSDCSVVRTYVLVEGVGFTVWLALVCGLPCVGYTPNTPWLSIAGALAVAQGVYSFVAIKYLATTSKEQCGTSLWAMGVADATLSGILGAILLLWLPLALLETCCNARQDRLKAEERNAKKAMQERMKAEASAQTAPPL